MAHLWREKEVYVWKTVQTRPKSSMCYYAKERHRSCSVKVSEPIGLVSLISLTPLYPRPTTQDRCVQGHWIEPAGSAEWASLIVRWLLPSLLFDDLGVESWFRVCGPRSSQRTRGWTVFS